MSELIIIIVIIGLAAVYVARNYYRKFMRGKSPDAGCGCTNCDCSGQQNCHPESTTTCKAGGSDSRP